jgi:hypothetical protein
VGVFAKTFSSIIFTFRVNDSLLLPQQLKQLKSSTGSAGNVGGTFVLEVLL